MSARKFTSDQTIPPRIRFVVINTSLFELNPFSAFRGILESRDEASPSIRFVALWRSLCGFESKGLSALYRANVSQIAATRSHSESFQTRTMRSTRERSLNWRMAITETHRDRCIESTSPRASITFAKNIRNKPLCKRVYQKRFEDWKSYKSTRKRRKENSMRIPSNPFNSHGRGGELN
jgi:hypothetical protein